MDDSIERPAIRVLNPLAARPMAVDAAIALLVGTVELINLYREVTIAGYEPPLPVGAVAGWLLAISALLVLRRRAPVAVLVAVGVAAGAYAVIDLPTLNLPLLVAVFTAGAAIGATTATGSVLVVGVTAVNLLRGTLSQLPIDLVVFGAVWLLGIHLRVRQQHALDLQRRREAELWRARSQERTRLAQDLHDIVSNGVGGIYLQAVGAAGVLDEDPRQASAALAAIQTGARTTLDELRRLLEVLRLDPDGPTLQSERAATPSLHDLPALLERTRAIGAELVVDTDGDLDAVSAGVSTTAYRIVQEALGNAIRHGGDGPINLHLDATGRGLQIEVTNTLAAPHGVGCGGEDAEGHWGLVGMRERVRALGGRLDTDERAGRFHLSADLPVHDEVG